MFIYTNLNVNVEHLNPDADNANKEGYLPDLSLVGVKANIQPSTPEVVALYGGAYGKVYSMYTTASGILETDRVTVSGTSQKYIVKGKQNFNYSVLQHCHYILEEIL